MTICQHFSQPTFASVRVIGAVIGAVNSGDDIGVAPTCGGGTRNGRDIPFPI